MVAKRVLSRVRATALLIGVVLASPLAAQSGRDAAQSNIRIDNFGSINAHYFRGAQPNGRDYADLSALGVKTVIDLTADGENSSVEAAAVKDAGMKFFRIPMTTRIVPTAEQIDQFLKLVNDPENQPVYVHCQGGRHRTGVMTAVYRMTQNGWTADQAFSEMKHYNFGADFLHPEFKRFVYSYHPQVAAADVEQVAATQPSAKLAK